jgi:NitT/TauT family transport system ATP-binding protein
VTDRADVRQILPFPTATDGTAPKLSLRAVTKTYQQGSGVRIPAIDDVTLNVGVGEFVCLIGPSGCGKSTLLNLAAGLDRPDSGQVLMDGRSIDGPGPERAVLFQEPALFPWLDVAGNIEIALRFAGVGPTERAARRALATSWLEKVGLSAFAGGQPHELSAGMRQRAALARALACQPQVLLADEPFGALDAQSREMLQRELQEVWLETKNTCLFATHNVREAVFLADRVIVMSARPGTLLSEHRISAPRPRSLEDPLLAKVVVDVHDQLLGEVEQDVPLEGHGLTDLA